MGPKPELAIMGLLSTCERETISPSACCRPDAHCTTTWWMSRTKTQPEHSAVRGNTLTAGGSVGPINPSDRCVWSSAFSPSRTFHLDSQDEFCTSPIHVSVRSDESAPSRCAGYCQQSTNEAVPDEPSKVECVDDSSRGPSRDRLGPIWLQFRST